MERPLNQDEVIKLADAGAGGSIVAWMVSHLGSGEAVTTIAGIVAIVAGLAATWFHIERALDLRRQRKDRKE